MISVINEEEENIERQKAFTSKNVEKYLGQIAKVTENGGVLKEKLAQQEQKLDYLQRSYESMNVGPSEPRQPMSPSGAMTL